MMPLACLDIHYVFVPYRSVLRMAHSRRLQSWAFDEFHVLPYSATLIFFFTLFHRVLCSQCSLIDVIWLQVVEIMSNTRLSERYLALARDLDVLEPKLPEDVYKMHLVDTYRGGLAPALDSAAKNLSSTLVNALVNLGFGNDKLVTPATQEGERSWVSRNKDHGKTCAVASIGVRFSGMFSPTSYLVYFFRCVYVQAVGTRAQVFWGPGSSIC